MTSKGVGTKPHRARQRSRQRSRPGTVSYRESRTAGSGQRPKGGQPRTRSKRLVPWLAIGVVIAVAGAFVLVKTVSHPRSATTGSPAPASVLRAATGVPVSAFQAAGVSGQLEPPTALPKSTPALTSGGLPRIVYIGAEYCPFCAAQRWAMVVAMSRFGTFSGLGATESSTTDVYPGTKTFTFYRSTYSSPYLVFTPVELQTNQPSPDGGYTPLQRATAEEQRLIDEFDRAPYTNSPGAVPFTDIGNRFVVIGSTFSPAVLQGLSMANIAAALSTPTRRVGAAVLGSANLLTAAICQATGGKPGSVCSSPVVVQANARLGGSG